jgi:hypothetical protein
MRFNIQSLDILENKNDDFRHFIGTLKKDILEVCVDRFIFNINNDEYLPTMENLLLET